MPGEFSREARSFLRSNGGIDGDACRSSLGPDWRRPRLPTERLRLFREPICGLANASRPARDGRAHLDVHRRFGCHGRPQQRALTIDTLQLRPCEQDRRDDAGRSAGNYPFRRWRHQQEAPTSRSARRRARIGHARRHRGRVGQRKRRHQRRIPPWQRHARDRHGLTQTATRNGSQISVAAGGQPTLPTVLAPGRLANVQALDHVPTSPTLTSRVTRTAVDEAMAKVRPGLARFCLMPPQPTVAGHRASSAHQPQRARLQAVQTSQQQTDGPATRQPHGERRWLRRRDQLHPFRAIVQQPSGSESPSRRCPPLGAEDRPHPRYRRRHFGQPGRQRHADTQRHQHLCRGH